MSKRLAKSIICFLGGLTVPNGKPTEIKRVAKADAAAAVQTSLHCEQTSLPDFFAVIATVMMMTTKAYVWARGLTAISAITAVVYVYNIRWCFVQKKNVEHVFQGRKNFSNAVIV